MRKLFVSEWMSLDGVFDAESMEQWYAPYDSKERQAYITDVIMSTDAIVMGRITYEMLAPYWGSLKNNEMGIAAKLNSAPKYVVSTTLKKADWNNSTIIKENVVGEIRKLKEQPGGDIHIEGSGTLVATLMEAGLVDELWLLVHPFIMGKGKRFFKEGMDLTGLELVKTQPLAMGVLAVRYKPVSKEQAK